jgi:hypothetical protein
LYFSHKFSHTLLNEEFVEIRHALEGRDEEQGLLFLLQGKLALSADIQRSWLKSGEPFIRYEDLLQDDLRILKDVLLRHCELRVSRERLREVAAT